MLESEAIVVSVKNGATFVEAQSSGGCGSNHCATQGCSTAVLTQLFSQSPKTLEVQNPISAVVGERVLVGLQEDAFLRSAMAVYLLPLFALIGGAALGIFWAGQSDARDLYAGLGGIIGLAVSALLLKFLTPTFLPYNSQPIILRRL